MTTRGQILRRGLTKRCPVCGSGGLFEHWTKMRERCPGCGHRFERRSEDGFFLGALVINFVVAESVLGVVAALYIAALAGGGRTSIWPYLGTAASLSVVMPAITYPFSKTFWAAIDLVMHPPEPAEEADAILYEHR